MKKIAMAWYFMGLIVIAIAAFSDPEVSKVQGAFIFLAFAIGFPLTIKKAIENKVNGLFFWMLGSSVASYIALPAIYFTKTDPGRKFCSLWYETKECTDNRALILLLNVIIKSLGATSDGLHLYNSILNNRKISQNEADGIIKNQNSINVTIPTDRETQLSHICAVLQLANNLKNSTNENVDECLNHLVKCGYDQKLIPVAYERLTEAIRVMEESEKEEQEQDYIDAEIVEDSNRGAKTNSSVKTAVIAAAGTAMATKAISPATPKKTVAQSIVPPPVHGKENKCCGTCEFWSGHREFKDRPYNQWVKFSSNEVAVCNGKRQPQKFGPMMPNSQCHQRWAQIKV